MDSGKKTILTSASTGIVFAVVLYLLFDNSWEMALIGFLAGGGAGGFINSVAKK